MKQNKQGVRDLGNDTRKYALAQCAPHIYGDLESLGHRIEGELQFRVPVYGRRCLKCGMVKAL